jgi:hypothetical protein
MHGAGSYNFYPGISHDQSTSEATRLGMPMWIILHLVAYIYPQPPKLCNDETWYI